MSVEVFPVVHIRLPGTALEQTDKAFSLGADGVYLIDHEGPSGEGRVLNVYNQARHNHPDQFIGVNFCNYRQ